MSSRSLSPRIIVATVAGLVLVSSAFYINSQGDDPETVTSATLAVATSTAPVIADDTWRDVLAEAKAEVAEEIPEVASSTVVLEEGDVQLTETDFLARDLLVSYLNTTDDGSYTPQEREAIAAKAAKSIFLFDFTPLEPKDMIATDDVSTSSVRMYREAMHEAVQPLFELENYELTVYGRAIRDNTKEDFEALAVYAGAYKEAGNAVLAIAAPNDVSAVHLEIINALLRLSSVLEKMSQGYNDPIQSISGVGNFIETEESFRQAFQKLRTYFILRGVIEETL